MKFELSLSRRGIRYITLWTFLAVTLIFQGCQQESEDSSSVVRPQPAIAVVSTTPGNNESGIAVDTPIGVTFSKPLLKSSVSLNTSDSKCRGAIMLSRDEFGTCLPMRDVSFSDGDKTVTLSLASDLKYNSTYKIRVGTEIADASKRQMEKEYKQGAGFSTVADGDAVADSDSAGEDAVADPGVAVTDAEPGVAARAPDGPDRRPLTAPLARPLERASDCGDCQSGIFVDKEVIGINYKTETLSGKTDGGGAFKYRPGETVTFLIGDLEFPPVRAANRLTPLDLAGTDDVYDPQVKKMAALLQTLDTDGDPSNGIRIEDEVHRQAEGLSVEFDDPNFDSEVAEKLSGDNEEKEKGLAKKLAETESKALDHLKTTLGSFAGMIVSKISNTTGENSRGASFTVKLTKEPTGPVVIDVVSSDPGEGKVDKEQLTFTAENFKEAQAVEITGVDDEVRDGTQEYQIHLTVNREDTEDEDYKLVGPRTVVARNVDNEVPEVLVGPISGNTSEDRDRAFFTVRLSGEPDTKITVHAFSDNPNEGTVLPPTKVTFDKNNYDREHIFTVVGQDDEKVDGDLYYKILFSVYPASADRRTRDALMFKALTGAPPGTGFYTKERADEAGRKYPASPLPVKIKNIDNDRPGLTIGKIEGPASESGALAVFDVKPDTRIAEGNRVKIEIEAVEGEDEVDILDRKLIFHSGDHDEGRVFRVRGKDDNVEDGDQWVTLKLSVDSGDAKIDPKYSELKARYVSFRNLDNDNANVVVDWPHRIASESDVNDEGFTTEEANGKNRRLSVQLNKKPDGDVTIHVVAQDPWEAKLRKYDHFLKRVVSTGTSEAFHPATKKLTLTFNNNNYNQPQFVQVIGMNDDTLDGDRKFSIRVSIDPDAKTTTSDIYRSLSSKIMIGTNLDDEASQLIVLKNNSYTSEDGRKVTAGVRLSRQPLTTVKVKIKSLNPDEGRVEDSQGLEDGFLTFTPQNWDKTQSVVIVGVDDKDSGNPADGTRRYDVRFRIYRVVGGTEYRTPLVRQLRLFNYDNDKELSEYLYDDLGLGGDQTLHVSDSPPHLLPNVRFGESVSLHGGRLAIGAPGKDREVDNAYGAVHLYKPSISRDANGKKFWRLFAGLSMKSLFEGRSGGRSDNSDRIYQKDSGFGTSVALYGNTLVVGAPDYRVKTYKKPRKGRKRGAVYIFEIVGDQLVRRQLLTITDADYADVDGSGNENGLNYEPTDAKDNERFGESVALYKNYLAVGAPGESICLPSENFGIVTEIPLERKECRSRGAVYIYERDHHGIWRFAAFVKPVTHGTRKGNRKIGFGGKCNVETPGVKAGNPMALYKDTLAIGNCRDSHSGQYVKGDRQDVPFRIWNYADNNYADNFIPGSVGYRNNSGAVQVFRRTGKGWRFDAYIKSPKTQENGLFGFSVSLKRNFLVVGAPGQSYPHDKNKKMKNSGAIIIHGYDSHSAKWDGKQTMLFRRYLKRDNAANDYFGAFVSLPYRLGERSALSPSLSILTGGARGISYMHVSDSRRDLPFSYKGEFPGSIAVGHGLIVFGNPDFSGKPFTKEGGQVRVLAVPAREE